MTELPDRLAAAIDGRFTIQREIGRGVMATVYLATDAKDQQTIALKVLRSGLSSTLDRPRFLTEVEPAVKLRHANIVPLLEAGEASGFLFCVMPFIDGKSLRDRLAQEGEYPVPQAAGMLVEIADALAAAHAAGVVHRDLKPGNVMLDAGHARVADFGVARAVDVATGAKRLSSVGVTITSPLYLSPEQASAEPVIDHRADLYAFGVVAYELLAGRVPFGGPSARVLIAHMSQAPQPLAQARSGIAPGLDAIVMRCLAKKPAGRFQTAAELSSALKPFA